MLGFTEVAVCVLADMMYNRWGDVPSCPCRHQSTLPPSCPSKPLKTWPKGAYTFMYMCVQQPLSLSFLQPSVATSLPGSPQSLPMLFTNTLQVTADFGHMWIWPCVHLTTNWHASYSPTFTLIINVWLKFRIYFSHWTPASKGGLKAQKSKEKLWNYGNTVRFDSSNALFFLMMSYSSMRSNL